MASFTIRRGMDLQLAGAPRPEISDASGTDAVSVFPPEYVGIKPRLNVKEGDRVARGGTVLHDKKDAAFQVCSPASGVVSAIQYGARRVVEQIRIQVDGAAADSFPAHEVREVLRLSRVDVLALLQRSGLLALIRQRPFGKMAQPSAKPKSIFVNGMATAPFRTRLDVAVQGQEAAFQAGLNALKRLTDGPVRLILPGGRSDLPQALTGAEGVDVHTFEGPHPAGNTSVHIHHLDPILPGDVVWAIDGVDLPLIGRLLLEGRYPSTRIISLGGPGVKEASRKHYHVHAGGNLQPLLHQAVDEGEMRLVNGDVLCADVLRPDQGLPFLTRGITVLPEDRSRHLLGWLDPGASRYSHSRAFLSTWVARSRSWALGTNENGGHRAMVLTGLYDRYMPMNIMVDYLVRAVLANDTEEAVRHGILETMPEDFGLCTFVCPSKNDIGSIISRGLALIEREGI